MSRLQAIQLEDGSTLYIEVTDDVVVPEVVEIQEGEGSRTGKGGGDQIARQLQQNFEAIESTIRTYTKYTLNAFKDSALSEVEKVTMEFGVKVGGAAGVPYIANGTGECSIKVTVECKFPERQGANIAQQMAQAQRNPPPMPQNPAAPRQ